MPFIKVFIGPLSPFASVFRIPTPLKNVGLLSLIEPYSESFDRKKGLSKRFVIDRHGCMSIYPSIRPSVYLYICIPIYL